MRHWTWLTPLLALGLLLVTLAVDVGTLLAGACGAALVGAVLVAVHHAEVVAHRVGEPLGTLVLALAVTAIETALIVSMMIAGGEEMAVLPRDAIYAAVMIICNGVIGLCVLLGGLAHHEQTFRVEGAGGGLAALMVMAALTLVLPVFTTSTPAGTYSSSQLAFVAITSAAIWAIFIFVQTVRHRDYFIPAIDAANPDAHAEPPSTREAWASFGLLLVSLVAVVGLAKVLSPTIEHAVEAANAPRTRGRNRDRRARAPARNVGRGACGPGGSASEQHESCDWLRAGLYWSHRSDRGVGVQRLRLAPGPGLGRQRHGDARGDVPRKRCHARHRSHLYDAGGSSSGALCGVPVSRIRALSSDRWVAAHRERYRRVAGKA